MRNLYSIGDWIKFKTCDGEGTGCIREIRGCTKQIHASRSQPERSVFVGDAPSYRILGFRYVIPEIGIIGLVEPPPEPELKPEPVKTGKHCFKCKLEKPYSAFYKNIRSHDGYASQCAVCARQYEKTKSRPRVTNRSFARW